MKKIYLLSMLIALFSDYTSGQEEGWTEQTSPSPLMITAIQAIDSLNVWAVGQEGLIIHSSDGGLNWVSVPNNTTSNLSAVEFINADTGFVGGREDETSNQYFTKLIQRTTDGGATWEFQHSPSGGGTNIADIDFVEGPPGSPMRGFCTGGLSYSWRTYDYGETWETLRGGCGEGNFNSLYMIDSITGWFVGTPSNTNEYTIMVTKDGGELFTEQTEPVGVKLNGVSFGTDLKGVAVGNAGTVIYTSDGGENWEQCIDDDLSYITWFSVYLSESGKAWAVGNNGKIIHSNDWGHSWEAQESGVTQPLWDVYFINDNVGWVVGGLTESVILYTENGGMTSTGFGDPLGKGYNFSILEQNIPNPFKSSTLIRYKLYQPGHIDLSIIDITGRKIQTLVNENQPTGEHSINFGASHLKKGIYFYRIVVNNEHSEVRKMVLVR